MKTEPKTKRGAKVGNQNARKTVKRVHINATIDPETWQIIRDNQHGKSIGAAIDKLIMKGGE